MNVAQIILLFVVTAMFAYATWDMCAGDGR